MYYHQKYWNRSQFAEFEKGVDEYVNKIINNLISDSNTIQNEKSVVRVTWDRSTKLPDESLKMEFDIIANNAALLDIWEYIDEGFKNTFTD